MLKTHVKSPIQDFIPEFILNSGLNSEGLGVRFGGGLGWDRGPRETERQNDTETKTES